MDYGVALTFLSVFSDAYIIFYLHKNLQLRRYVRCKRKDQTFFIPFTRSDTILQLKERIVAAYKSTTVQPSTITEQQDEDFTSKLMGKRSSTSRRTTAAAEELVTTTISSPSDVKLFFGGNNDDDDEDEKQEVVDVSTVADYDFDCDTILYMVYRRRPRPHRTLLNEDSDYEEEDDMWEDIQVDEWTMKD